MTNKLWPPAGRDVKLFAGAGVVLLATWFPRLLPGSYSVDDYRNLEPGYVGTSIAASLQQGRFVQALLHGLSWRLGVDPIHSVTLLNLCAVVLLAACAVLLLRLWSLEETPVLGLLAAGLCLCHPYGADLWSFRLAPISYALALLPALLAVVLLRYTSGGLLLPMALFTGSFAVYQVNFNPLVIVLVFALVLDLVRVGHQETAARAALRVWGVIGGTALASFVLYLLLNQLVLRLASVPAEQRAALLQPDQLPARAREVAQQLQRILYGERQLGTGLLSALQLWLLCLGLGAAGIWALAARSLRRFALVLALLGVALLSTVGLVALGRVFWPTPRVLIGAGFFWAGLLALAATVLRGPLRLAALGAGALLLLGWAGTCHRAADEQHRLNLRDQLRMSRVLGRLEALPGGGQLRRIALVNGQNSYWDLKTVIGDLNVSGFFRDWSWTGLATEAGGPQLAPPTPEDEARAEAFCKGAGRWPAADAVGLLGDLGVVCFDR